MYANFSIVKPKYALTEDILETYTYLSEDECENKCIEHRLCKSINTRNSTGENCQLSSKSTEDPFDNVTLSAISEWTYKTTDHKARNVNKSNYQSFKISFLPFPIFLIRKLLIGIYGKHNSYKDNFYSTFRWDTGN